MNSRYLASLVADDLKEKMVFLGGPRQVGKTTMARQIAEGVAPAVYLNWDNRDHRRMIMHGHWSPDAKLVLFDELHKYRSWKNLVKGFWDTRLPHLQIMVTGSSRLDVYRRGGDSLQGRYHYYRLHPFSLRELNHAAPYHVDDAVEHMPQRLGDALPGLDHLMRFGGFPEPCLQGSERGLRRWQNQRFERVFREDIRDTESLRSLADVELLGTMLPDRVAAPLSFSSLATDLEVSPKTVKSWIELLCRNYYIFRVPPYHRRLPRALKKESKYYMWDWSEVKAEGARFENMVASHLLKYCHFNYDVMGEKMELYYLRDLEKREVDFLVTREQKPWLIVECKKQAGGSLTALNYFSQHLKVDQRFMVVLASGVDHVDRSSGIRVVSADRFLSVLV